MRIISHYKSLGPEQQMAGGIGQGGGRYWEDAVGQLLQQEIATILDAELCLCPRPHGRDSFDRRDYDIDAGNFDIAYCQLFEVPKRRPASWVYSIISDYISMEEVLEDFLARTKPDVIISFQYPLDPPEGKPNLVSQCANHGCKVVFMPWFNVHNCSIYESVREVRAMCTGKIGGTYPMRDRIYKYLESLGRSDIVLSGNPHGSTFTLSDEDYRNALSCCRYYVTGGIYDIQIPPKYYEVCNYGATLVSPELPMMKEAGFIDGQTYIKLDTVEQIPGIIDSDRWVSVGVAGRLMVQDRHSLHARARDIVELWKNDIGMEAGKEVEPVQ